jgi:hypothetical protein
MVQSHGDAADVPNSMCAAVHRCCGCVGQVEVTDVAADKTWYFAGECWLDATQGDGMTERLLAASDKDPRADMIAYKVGVIDYE